MRRWGVIWLVVAVVCLSVVALQPSTRTSAQGGDQAATIAALQTAVARMQTQVAILQTRVPGSSSAGSGAAAATVVAGNGKIDTPAAVGQRVTANGLTMTLVGVQEVKSFSILAPTPGNIFLVLDFKIVDIVHDTKDYSDNWFSGSDVDQGYAFHHPATNPTAQPLGHGTLKGAGDLIRGTAVLEVNASSHRIRIKYDTDAGFGGSNESVYWLYTR
jgi:hypothetical protein